MDGDVWEDPTEAENFETADSQGFISTEEVLSLPSAEGSLSPPEILPLIGEMSAGPAVTFSEGEARQDNTDVS